MPLASLGRCTLPPLGGPALGLDPLLCFRTFAHPYEQVFNPKAGVRGVLKNMRVIGTTGAGTPQPNRAKYGAIGSAGPEQPVTPPKTAVVLPPLAGKRVVAAGIEDQNIEPI